ncbi:EpsG family protein [Clostridium sp. MSJ-11]|uniref:EpsG family protein n=1 Tax=Clostridium mobile TaxID=2841512 RepID=A0ABS6ELW5_9CLOT|nr:EpsG family protein [Clostridium mobile]MBU5485767.1 EpsG family protein [Clostridium mobile]
MYYIFSGLLIYVFFLSIITKKNKVLSEILGLVLLTFFTVALGLRYGVGIDYFSYENSFNIHYNTFTYEPLYSLLMYIIKLYFDKFYYLTFIMLFLTNLFIYLGLKKRKIEGIYILLALFIYFSNTAMTFINLMRQGLAVAIFFYASTYITEKKFKKYLAFILLGAGFHYSILLLLPLYFFKFKFTKRRYLISVIICYVLVYTKAALKLINYVASKIPMYSHYYNSHFFRNDEISILSFGVLLNIVVILTLLLVKENKNLEHSNDVNYYLIGTLFNVMSLSTFIFDRIGMYFFVFGISGIPILLMSIKRRKLRNILFMFVFFAIAIYFSQVYLMITESSSLYYRSIFSK